MQRHFSHAVSICRKVIECRKVEGKMVLHGACISVKKETSIFIRSGPCTLMDLLADLHNQKILP